MVGGAPAARFPPESPLSSRRGGDFSFHNDGFNMAVGGEDANACSHAACEGERNLVREGERRRTASELAFILSVQADEFLKLATKAHRVLSTERRQCKPGDDFLKINVDGSFIAETQKGGWGFVTRDRGNCNACRCALELSPGPWMLSTLKCWPA